MIKLNIGSGFSGLESWLNFDWGILPLLSKFPRIRGIIIKLGIITKNYDVAWPKIRLVDIRNEFPLGNSCLQYIYCSHVLEHFNRWEALRILKECRRVLVKGGTMRMVVPDIDKLYKIYKDCVSNRSSNPADSRCARDLCRVLWGYDKDIEPSNFIQRFSIRFIREHQWHYDKYELELLLKESGFYEINHCGFREGVVPDIDRLDLQEYKFNSLFVEITKT